jgi:DNA-binding response OmpR family regulator
MLTALSDQRIMEQSYLMGAGDYLVKPFTKNKLFERIDRIARQLDSFVEDGKTTWSNDFKVETEKNELIYRGQPIEMTTNELKMLSRLMENAYMEVSFFDLYEAVWGREPLPLRTKQALVNSTITNLRDKIENDPKNPKIFLNSDKGYTFCPS